MYEEYKIYGPYLRKDGRRHVCLVHNITKQKRTVSYPKYKMECKLERYLEKNEQVHHINGNESDDSDDNLIVVNTKFHKIAHMKHVSQIMVCVECKQKFLLTEKEVSERYRSRNRTKNGPFCTRNCSGKFTRRNQLAK